MVPLHSNTRHKTIFLSSISSIPICSLTEIQRHWLWDLTEGSGGRGLKPPVLTTEFMLAQVFPTILAASHTPTLLRTWKILKSSSRIIPIKKDLLFLHHHFKSIHCSFLPRSLWHTWRETLCRPWQAQLEAKHGWALFGVMSHHWAHSYLGFYMTVFNWCTWISHYKWHQLRLW